MVRKTEPRRWPSVIGIVAVTAAVVLTPWLLRNLSEMGRPILLRDNFGLELAQAFYPEALTTTDDKRTFLYRHRSIHPFGDQAISALALAGIAYGVRQVGARYAYVAFFALLPLVSYILVQPTLRYRYLVTTLFTYIAADFLSRL